MRPGDRVPADGVVTDGASSLDESLITGESVPKAKEPGDAVYAGSVNADGALQVRVTREAADNMVARILHLVEEAQASKSPTARFI
ncbi:heavy metal translocating P-type ATPase, partial [Acinetobacter baumannii]